MALLFRGQHSALSNFYLTTINYKEQAYPSTEHAYQHAKLRHHNVPDADQVIKMSSGYTAMNFAQSLVPKSSQSWAAIKFDIMWDVLVEKFYSCAPYRHALLSSPEFIENTPNKYWGRGQNFQGQNKLGSLHSMIRTAWRSVLVAGSSHSRDMDVYLEQEFRNLSLIVTVETVCIPGGLIENVKAAVLSRDLTKYDAVIIVTGSNDLFTKQGVKRHSPKKVASDINALVSTIQSGDSTKVILTPVLPRATQDPPKGLLTRDHFKFSNLKTKYVNRHIQPSFTLPQLWKRHHANTHYLKEDGVHLNKQGKTLVAKAWAQVFLGCH